MYNQPLMTQVTKKDDQEHLENLLRRFNRKVQQSGALTTARRRLYHEKPQSRTQRRQAALARQERKKAKIRKMYLGR
jgi:ribosomal protein S21